MTLKKLTDFYQQTDKMPAPNGRFCESGGVARPTLCVEQPLPLSSKPRQYPRPRKAAKTLSDTHRQQHRFQKQTLTKK